MSEHSRYGARPAHSVGWGRTTCGLRDLAGATRGRCPTRRTRKPVRSGRRQRAARTRGEGGRMDDAIRVDVERTGGFGGLVTRRSVDTRSLPTEDGQQLARLVRGLDVDALTRTGPGRSVPDAFQYDILISTE